MKRLALLFSTVLFVSAFTTQEITSVVYRDAPYHIRHIQGVSYSDDDQFHILVGSISTSDEKLFPGVGQIILHTTGTAQNLMLKGAIIATPELISKYLYFSLEKINNGKEFVLIRATKYGITLPVLKMQLYHPEEKISSMAGGVLRIRILKNALFYSFSDYKFQLSRESGGWIGKVKSHGSFMPVRSMYLTASKFGVRKVDFM